MRNVRGGIQGCSPRVVGCFGGSRRERWFLWLGPMKRIHSIEMDRRMKVWKINFCKRIQFILYTNSVFLLAPFFKINLLYRKHSSYYTKQKHLKPFLYDSHYGGTGPMFCRFQKCSLLPSPPMEPTRVRPCTYVSKRR